MGTMAFGKDNTVIGRYKGNPKNKIVEEGPVSFFGRDFSGKTRDEVSAMFGSSRGENLARNIALGKPGKKSKKSGGPSPKKETLSTAKTTANAGASRSRRSILAGSTNTGGGASLLGRSK